MFHIYVPSTVFIISHSPSDVADDVQSKCDFLTGLSGEKEYQELMECIDAFSVSSPPIFIMFVTQIQHPGCLCFIFPKRFEEWP
jgi:hypothetical protein